MKIWWVNQSKYPEDGACVVTADTREQAIKVSGYKPFSPTSDDRSAFEISGATANPPARILMSEEP